MMSSYYSYIRATILAVLVAPFLQVARASASAQYHLSVDSDISKCWIQCHGLTVNLLSEAYYQANEQQLTVWCKNDEYVQSLPECLLAACRSAPDVAYALEFGNNWCAKAGVDISEKLVLPENYTQVEAKEYFQSTEYLSGAHHRATYLSSLGAVLVLGAVFTSTLWAI